MDNPATTSGCKGDRILQNLRRRLEKWELDHLRKLAADLSERLERAEEAKARAEEESRRAWDNAEFWRENALELQEALMADDFTIGLTKDGQILAFKPGSPADAQAGDCGVEQVDAAAHEHDAIAIGSGSQDHADACGDGIGASDVDTVNGAPQPGPLEVIRQHPDALVPGRGDSAGLEVSHDDGHSDAPGAGNGGHDGVLDAADGRQQDAADLHKTSPECAWIGDPGMPHEPIDWSLLTGRTVIVHPDDDTGNAQGGPK